MWEVAHAVFGRTAAATAWASTACKTIVSIRAKRSGMRWTPEGSHMAMARQKDSTVMLSAAKHLEAHRDRPFAAAQGGMMGPF